MNDIRLLLGVIAILLYMIYHRLGKRIEQGEELEGWTRRLLNKGIDRIDSIKRDTFEVRQVVTPHRLDVEDGEYIDERYPSRFSFVREEIEKVAKEHEQ